MSAHGDAALAMIGEVLADGVDHAAVLLRHSARTFEPGLHDLDNLLTDEGRALCCRFGRRLPKELTLRAYASPAQRCLETAQLILEAHEAEGGSITRHRPVEALGVFYALDQMKMW
ncbi:MAG: histidine phosphatase family protein, partial [Gammaproteobacteria bacterium]|nr:histidine phosphatase family protein [Gammaproteobacteria bacterium]